MEYKNFESIDETTKKELSGSGFGAAFGILIASLPTIVAAIASMAGSYRILFSDSGEVKSKDGLNQKWDKSNAPNSTNAKSSLPTALPTYFVY